MKAKSQEDLFAFQCRSSNLPAFERQYSFAKAVERGWKFDFAWDLPATATSRRIKLAVEIEGIVVRRVRILGADNRVKTETIASGRHATIQGFKEDCIKYSTAAMLGWTVLRFEQSQVRLGFAVAMTMRVLHRRGWRPGLVA